MPPLACYTFNIHQPILEFLRLRHPASAKALYFFGRPSLAFVLPFVRSFVRSSIPGQILLPWYVINGLSNSDATYTQYSLAPTDATQLVSGGQRPKEGQGHSRPWNWRRHPRRRWGVKVHFLVGRRYVDKLSEVKWSEFQAICNHCGVMTAWSCKTWKFLKQFLCSLDDAL